MAKLKLIQFSGEIPRMLPRLLPDTAALRAENVRLDNGGLAPVRRAKQVHTIAGIDPGNVKTIYKHVDDWLAWETVVNAAPGPVAQDRLYYTGDGTPKMRSITGQVYDLAVPYPTAALTATASGSGSGDIITRVYAYTFVTDFGEESEPCTLSNEVNWQPGMTMTLSGFQSAPAGREITKQRIYRLQSSVASGADLFFIAERAASTSDFVDTVAVDDFAEVLPSRDWNQPPDNLAGLISLPNGMMAAFVGKDLYFCEPYRPHAWPEKYVLTMDFNIVGLGAYGNSIVVATEGNPYIVEGTAPEVMQQARLELNMPCINARGIVDLGYGVAYPSHDGLVLASGGSASVVTSPGLMTRNDWINTSPATFVAGQYSGRYFASYAYIDETGAARSGTFMIDLSGEKPFLIRASRHSDASYYDVKGSALYMVDGLGVFEWDALGEVSEIMKWESKEFVLPAPVSYGCILIETDDRLTPEQQAAQDAYREQVEANNALLFPLPSIGGEINGTPFNTYPINGDMLERLVPATFTAVKVFADGRLVATINETDKVKRLPAVGRAKNWKVSVNGSGAIAQITMATMVQELNEI